MTSHEVDSFLFFLHSFNILSKAGEFFIRVGRVESEKFGKTGSVGVILNNTKFNAKRKRILVMCVEFL